MTYAEREFIFSKDYAAALSGTSQCLQYMYCITYRAQDVLLLARTDIEYGIYLGTVL